MTLIKCKECKAEVSNKAKTCPSCGVKNPGITLIHQLGGLVLLLVIIVVAVNSCSDDDSSADYTSAAAVQQASESPLDALVREATSHVPKSTSVINSTQYMAIIFDRKVNTAASAQLDAKRLMPVLLEQYPEINRFFMAWTADDLQVIKIQFERDQVEAVNWPAVRIGDGELEGLTSMYWTAPNYR